MLWRPKCSKYYHHQRQHNWRWNYYRRHVLARNLSHAKKIMASCADNEKRWHEAETTIDSCRSCYYDVAYRIIIVAKTTTSQDVQDAAVTSRKKFLKRYRTGSIILCRVWKVYLYHQRNEGCIVFSGVCLCVCLSGCLFVSLFVNTITPEPLEVSSRNLQGIILWSKGRTSSKMVT